MVEQTEVCTGKPVEDSPLQLTGLRLCSDSVGTLLLSLYLIIIYLRVPMRTGIHKSGMLGRMGRNPCKMMILAVIEF